MTSNSQENSQDTGILSSTSFRIDKYIVGDICNFNSQIDADERLVRNIIYSVAEDYEHSLFGFGQIDPAVFAERWQYDPSYLRKRVDQPFQLRDMSEEAVEQYRHRLAAGIREDGQGDERVWDTHLENAMYMLANKPFNFNSYGQFVIESNVNNKLVSVKQHTSFTLFTSIGAVRRGRGKVIYTYTLNENFEKNLTKYYIRGERDSLLKLRGCGLDSLYLYLSNLKINLALMKRSMVSPDTGGPGFNRLCDIAGIPAFTKAGLPYEPKKRKQALIDAMKKITDTTELHFTLGWKKGAGARAAYMPVIDFGEKHLICYANASHGLSHMIKDTEKFSIQRQLIQREFLNMYKKLYCTGYSCVISEEDFNAWALDKDRNRAEKETALRMAYISIFNMIPENIQALNSIVADAIQNGSGTSLSERLRRVKFNNAPDVTQVVPNDLQV